MSRPFPVHAIVALLVAAAALPFTACGDGDDAAPAATPGTAAPRTATPAGTAPAPTPTGGAPSPAATPAVRATPPPAAPATPPVAGAYAAVPAFTQFNFERMVGLFPVPGSGDAVALTQGGVAYIASLAGAAAPPRVYLDLRDKLIDNPGNEEGLLGLAFAPDYASSGRVFVYYSAGEPRRSVIARYDASSGVADPASAQVVLEVPQPFANHNGGALVFGPDGYLYIALGDGGAGGDPQGNGQNTGALLGKILRIDVSGDTYSVPADNPFATGGGRGEIWAYGLRNPWRFTFDRETGELWAGDVGQNRWEEVDRIVRGGNYGWNVMEGRECYGNAACDAAAFIAPRAVYGRDEGCSVTGGYVYRGAAMPELRGWYVYGDFCSGKVWAVNTRDESDAVLLAASGKPISSFAEADDGELYLVTFERAIFRLSRP